MNRSQRLIFKSNAQPLFKPQHRPECNMKHKNDMIGPPDPISNLRPIKYAVREDETSAEKELRIQREELQAWNTSFWTKNNLNFINKKKEFLSSELNKNSSKKESLSADEVSVFYKDFLDKNWNLHMKYLIEWYRRNLFVTFLHFKVNVLKMFRKKG